MCCRFSLPCVSPAPDTSPSGDLSRQCGSTTTPSSIVKCYVILFNEIYIYEMVEGRGGVFDSILYKIHYLI